MKISTTVFLFIMFIIVLLFNTSCARTASNILSLLIKDVPPGSEVIQAPTCAAHTYIVRIPDGTVYLYKVHTTDLYADSAAVLKHKYILFTPPDTKTTTSRVTILPDAVAVDYEHSAPSPYK